MRTPISPWPTDSGESSACPGTGSSPKPQYWTGMAKKEHHLPHTTAVHSSRLAEQALTHAALGLAVDARSGRKLDDRRRCPKSGRKSRLQTWVRQIEVDSGLPGDAAAWDAENSRCRWRRRRRRRACTTILADYAVVTTTIPFRFDGRSTAYQRSLRSQ